MFSIDKEVLMHKIKHNLQRAFISAKWVVFSILIGLLVGLIGTFFNLSLAFVTGLRATYPWLIFLLPVGGLVIVGAYYLFHNENDTGTNLVISTIHSGNQIPFAMAPLIFLSTLITHLLGGSAGREGAALQLGGSLGNELGRCFNFDESDQHIMIMCGMSAAFTALFGTPMAAAIFSMEVISVGVMYYSALLPCIISSLVAKAVAMSFGITGDHFALGHILTFDAKTALFAALIASACAFLSIMFCVVLHEVEWLFKEIFKNRYTRAFVGGVIVLALTLLIGNQSYNGSGMNLIEACFEHELHYPLAFLIKLIITAITISAGFKGGEIVPALSTGATFGYLISTILGFDPILGTAIGMISMFCGVTNCPISSLLIAFELFGYEAMPYFLLTIGFSYMLSGYFGLYHSQRIIYSKYHTSYINKHTI